MPGLMHNTWPVPLLPDSCVIVRVHTLGSLGSFDMVLWGLNQGQLARKFPNGLYAF